MIHTSEKSYKKILCSALYLILQLIWKEVLFWMLGYSYMDTYYSRELLITLQIDGNWKQRMYVQRVYKPGTEQTLAVHHIIL
jgi:hypothetical protein